MPPLPVIADCFRTTLNWTGPLSAGPNAVNVLHFSAPGKSPSQVYAAIDANVTANMWRSTVIAGSVISVDVTPLDGASATQTFNTGAPAKWTGAGGGDAAPQLCYLVKLATALRGPANRGRIYLPWLAETEQTGGNISAVAQPLITAAWVAFANAMATAGVALGVASYVNAEWHQVLNLACEQKIATQRRRMHR